MHALLSSAEAGNEVRGVVILLSVFGRAQLHQQSNPEPKLIVVQILPNGTVIY